MFVTVDGAGAEKKICRRSQNGIKCEGREKKIKKDLKSTYNHIFKQKFHW
jgi:hypothetical protein